VVSGLALLPVGRNPHALGIGTGLGQNALAQIGVLESMPEGKKGGRRLTKQGQQDIDRIAKEIFDSKQ
jgi:ribosomal protein S19E (S16A)